MTTEDFISELFYRVDETMKTVPKHPQASLWPSEVVTLGLLLALKGSCTSSVRINRIGLSVADKGS